MIRDGDSLSDWIGYQDNEIDGAKDAIGERIKHLAGTVDNGILQGTLIDERQNTRLKAYLEGYTDALEYAASEVDHIDNLAKYAYESGKRDAEDVVVLRFTGEPAEGLTFVEAETTDGESVSPDGFGGRWEQDGDDWLLRLGVGDD